MKFEEAILGMILISPKSKRKGAYRINGKSSNEKIYLSQYPLFYSIFCQSKEKFESFEWKQINV